ncbi:hypothetical protein DMUE_2285 [Dictyocoela muelleri]|nr:hypothetical protein DMUE_2285 [Dictyocoela muelleri]
MLNVVMWIRKSINLITETTIKNCWDKSGFFKNETPGIKQGLKDENDLNEEKSENEGAFEEVVSVKPTDFKNIYYSTGLKHLIIAFEIVSHHNSDYLSDLHNLMSKICDEYLDRHYKGSLDSLMFRRNK